MLLSAQSLLWAAGFEYDGIEETLGDPDAGDILRGARMRPGSSVHREALTEVHIVLDGIGCADCNFVVNAGCVSVGGPSVPVCARGVV